MQLKGEQKIAASREAVWSALNDPDVLRQCIPGCQSLEKLSDERMQATVEVKIGPIKARLRGFVVLSDLDPPNSYRITGEGDGGTVGMAKGVADVALTEAGDGTLLAYTVEAQVGGRLAQLGGRVIDVTAKQLASAFFSRFSEQFAATGQVEAGSPVSAALAAAGDEGATGSGSSAQANSQPAMLAWLCAVALAALVGFAIGSSAAGSDALPWQSMALFLLAILVAVAGFALGKSRGSSGIVLDRDALERLLCERDR